MASEKASSTSPDSPGLDIESNEQLDQNFSLLSLCGVAVTTGESWIILGNSLVFAIYNGGGPGVIYGFIVDSLCYFVVAASIAELASSMPTASTVYHWASITGGRHGRICGWFAGFWNAAAWIVGAASLVSVMALQLIAIYSTLHPETPIHNWHIFVAYIACEVVIVLIVAFGNKLIPTIESFGAFFILSGFAVSIIVCTVMPHVRGRPYASNHSVWQDWQNETGWKSNGYVFCLGMLNAAFAVCAPDIPSHLAEEIPRPKINVPIAILAQYVVSFVTGLCYLIALFYVTADLKAITTTGSGFPLAGIYLQATGSRSATAGLIVVTFIPTFIGTIGAFTISGRTIWALARSNLIPSTSFLARLDSKSKGPRNAILTSGVFVAALGCIYLGSSTAFNAIASSFVILTSLSYLAAILPHLLTRRRHVTPGPFWMGNVVGYAVNAFSCAYLMAFAVIFCFPPTLPVTAENMNWSSVVVGGFTTLTAAWWIIRRGFYEVPQLPQY